MIFVTTPLPCANLSGFTTKGNSKCFILALASFKLFKTIVLGVGILLELKTKLDNSLSSAITAPIVLLIGKLVAFIYIFFLPLEICMKFFFAINILTLYPLFLASSIIYLDIQGLPAFFCLLRSGQWWSQPPQYPSSLSTIPRPSLRTG